MSDRQAMRSPRTLPYFVSNSNGPASPAVPAPLPPTPPPQNSSSSSPRKRERQPQGEPLEEDLLGNDLRVINFP